MAIFLVSRLIFSVSHLSCLFLIFNLFEKRLWNPAKTISWNKSSSSSLPLSLVFQDTKLTQSTPLSARTKTSVCSIMAAVSRPVQTKVGHSLSVLFLAIRFKFAVCDAVWYWQTHKQTKRQTDWHTHTHTHTHTQTQTHPCIMLTSIACVACLASH